MTRKVMGLAIETKKMRKEEGMSFQRALCQERYAGEHNTLCRQWWTWNITRRII
jgi:hypothetical protein